MYKDYNVRVQPLFSSLNLLFSDVAVALVVFSNSLITIIAFENRNVLLYNLRTFTRISSA